MDNSRIIVREYLESLKEDSELDYLFPILLDLMGYQVVTIPRVAKGSKQYGKDVVAIGIDSEGVKRKYYFELKGEADKDITTHSFNKQDGIRESIQEALDKPYLDSGIRGFNELPAVIIVVHNGLLKQDIKEQFESFLQRNFPADRSERFERWDINYLAEVFHKHLFSEYLLTKRKNIYLFKRVLMFVTEPDYSFSDLRYLLDLMNEELKDKKGERALTKYFASIRLLSVLITHYCKESNNLHPALEGLTTIVLHQWHWILINRLENKRAILNQFKKLLHLQFTTIDDYFQKTLTTALLPDGLFSEQGQFFEEVGYSLRSFNYLSYYVYYCQLKQYFHVDSDNQLSLSSLIDDQKSTILTIIKQNIACTRPLLDSHLITIVQVVLFMIKEGSLSAEKDLALKQYVFDNLHQIFLIKLARKRWPMMGSNLSALIEYVATGERPLNYIDSSSLLVTTLFELLVVLKSEGAYTEALSTLKRIGNWPDLQLAHPSWNNDELENKFFSSHLHNEYDTESGIELPDDYQTFSDKLINIELTINTFKTDNTNFYFLNTLAQLHFKNEPFPDSWRRYLKRNTQD